MDHLEFTFENVTPVQVEMLVASFEHIGFTGFEELPNQLKAFVPKDEFDETSFAEICEKFNVKSERNLISATNWNEAWESSFSPVIIYHPGTEKIFAYIRASFHERVENAKHEVIITPKMSFGTGHHATTYLVAAEMSCLDFNNKIVIDFGTGTGVLAIIAEQEGASHVHAIDNDDWSITNAEENISANHCRKISLSKSETPQYDLPADIILANINRNVILDNLDNIYANCKPGGSVLLSGMLIADEKVILPALKKSGFEIIRINHREQWIMIHATRS